MPRLRPDQGRTFVVRIEANGDRLIAEVFGAEVTITSEPLYSWESDRLLQAGPPTLHTIALHGDLRTWHVYRGDVPEPEQGQQPAIEAPRLSLAERAAEAWDQRGAH